MPSPLVVVALPGFTRSPKHLIRLAQACERVGWTCVRPDLAPRWLPVLYLDRRRLQRLAARLQERTSGSPLVLAGHSAGASAACYLAALLVARGAQVRGVVLIDGVDSPNHLIERSLPHLRGQRIAAVLAPPSPCNRDGALATHLLDLPQERVEAPEVRVELVAGAGHGDIEGAGIGVYRRACGDTSDEATAGRFLDAVVGAIAWAGDVPVARLEVTNGP